MGGMRGALPQAVFSTNPVDKSVDGMRRGTPSAGCGSVFLRLRKKYPTATLWLKIKELAQKSGIARVETAPWPPPPPIPHRPRRGSAQLRTSKTRQPIGAAGVFAPQGVGMMQPPADESTRMKCSGTLDFGAAARLLGAEAVGQGGVRA